MKKLILASKSPRRIKILRDAGFEFEIIPAEIDEENYEHLSPLEMVKTLSRLKAEKVAKFNPNAIIIGSDTTINLNGKVISKPNDLENAFRMLKSLSGSTHEVITAYTIIDTKHNKIETDSEIAKVFFRDLNDEEINKYINSINVLGFAGAYGIQDGADKFVKKIEGDFLNIVGLPTKAIEKLKKYIE
jgi:septum formation protein